MLHNKFQFNWLILGTRNPYTQGWAPDCLKSHFGAKRVGNYIIIIIIIIII